MTAYKQGPNWPHQLMAGELTNLICTKMTSVTGFRGDRDVLYAPMLDKDCAQRKWGCIFIAVGFFDLISGNLGSALIMAGIGCGGIYWIYTGQKKLLAQIKDAAVSLKFIA